MNVQSEKTHHRKIHVFVLVPPKPVREPKLRFRCPVSALPISNRDNAKLEWVSTRWEHSTTFDFEALGIESWNLQLVAIEGVVSSHDGRNEEPPTISWQGDAFHFTTSASKTEKNLSAAIHRVEFLLDTSHLAPLFIAATKRGLSLLAVAGTGASFGG